MRHLIKCNWSPSMQKWFRPCPNTCICPKHNPPGANPKRCDPSSKIIPMRWDKKCIFEKHACARNHGVDCVCHACEVCHEEGDLQCHREYLHGSECDCSLCFEPHDYGCQCPECAAAAKGGVVYKLMTQGLDKSKDCRCGVCVEERRNDDDKEALKKLVVNLGEQCYCLFHHPKNCDCKQCKFCKEELKKDLIKRKVAAKRNRVLREVVEKAEQEHGKDCECLKCKAMRLRVEITMCNEHLEACRCVGEKGKACRCPIYAACVRRKRNATAPKAEDYW